MAEKKTLGQEFSKGLIKENPVLRLVLGTCPTLAVSTSIENAIGMGIAATIVLICSNIVISALRKVIPNKVRIPCYIVVIAAFVTIVQLFVKAFAPSLDASLGIYLPLIVVNCIILGRAEGFANKNGVIASAVDGVGMGVGFTIALTLMAAIREFFGSGNLTLKVLGYGTTLTDIFGLGETDVLTAIGLEPILIFILAPGGFFTFGLLMACANKLAEKAGKPKAELKGCEACPMAATCAMKADGKECAE
ncbi:MAG: electron transport complex subunit E [Clostridia bacterium]|nr:electron transport complex subunit E [Clostridia bacterium]